MMNNMFDYIELNLEEDKVYIKGTQIKVGEILLWLESGQSLDQIVENNSALSREAVQAAIAYRNRFRYAKC
jgi:uncharacterized protein (DUF433 family)